MRDRPWKRQPGALTGVVAMAVVMALAFAGLARARDVPFPTEHTIDAAFNGPRAVVAADVDGDGDADILGAATESHTIAWWENTAGDGTAWTRRIIATGFGRAQSVFAADMDGDGDLDVLGAAGTGDRIVWWENTAGDGTAWSAHTVAGFFNGVRWAFPVDLDSDGDLDVVAAASFVNDVAWWENTAGNGTAWARRNIDTSFGGANSVYAADVDGDGDTDVVGAASGANDIAWWENTNGAGTAWTKRILDGNFAGAWSVYAADVDSDGDLDVLGAASVAGEVTWWENTAGDGTAWTKRTVSGSLAGARSVFAADVDSDGDMDILGAGYVADDVRWWENTTGDGTAWIEHIVDAAFNGTRTVYAADLDSDGDMDVLAGAYNADTIAWWENETIHRSAVHPLEHLVDGAFDNPRSVFAADVDDDGDTDLLGAANVGDDVAWWENTAGDGTAWTEHMIDPSFNAAARVFAGDVDGDGDLDALAVAGLADDVTWWENTAGDGSAWTEHTIDPFFNDVRGMFAGDVDGDGDLDVVAAAGAPDDVAWWENTAGDGSAWTKRTIDGAFDFAVSVFTADVDADGDLDVLGAAISADTIAWWENTAGDGSAWTKRTVSAAFDGANSVYAADVDADGDTDVLGTAGGADTIAWWENTAGDGSAWTEHTVSAAFDGALSVYAADLDSDGDLDVAGAAATAGTITWWENTAGDGTAWTEHAVAGGFTGAYAVIAADVDSDGDLDVAGAAQNIDTIAWWENRGGQFALPTTDTAPTVLGDGQIDDLLAIAATHRGRGGDHDLELVTFELVFQKAAGDPLSSAEANAVIENLFIYRDDPLGADPGNFDPADPLVSTIATLTVSGSGLQVVSFIDGDPNLQVAFGTPRSYFAAVELTATAAAQVPNSFRITHLTETTSAGEDRDFDIPLDLEYAVNTSSGIVLAVPRPGFSKSFGPNPIFAAGVSTLVLVIDNLATAFAVTGLDFTDALPPDLVVATPANAATTCTGGVLTATPGTGVIAYTGGTVAASATCAVSVDVTTTVVGTHLNTSGALTSMLGSSGPAADALVVNPLADLVITKGDAPDPVVAGTGVSYTLTITNNGPSDATGVMASDTLPAGLSFVSAPGCAAAGGLVICMIGNMAAGDGIALTINATVDPGVTGTITNLAGVTGNETDPNLPNTVTETTAVVAETDLTVTKGDSPDPVAAGTVLTYTLTVANQGPSDATGVVATDTLPPEVSFVSAAAGCAAAGGVVTCTIGNLAAGGSAALTLNAAVDPAVTGTITNTAGVTGNETDPNLPNTVVETTAVVAEADLVVTKSDLVDPVTAGGSVRWMLRVTNYGPSNATGVVATDTLPSEVSIITVSPDCTVAGRVVLCTAGDLAADDSVLFDIAANVDPAASGPIINTARVSGNETDPLLPNTVEETTTIGVEADLAITKSAAPDPVAAGSPLTWTLQVMNLGPSTATGVVVADALPAGVSLVSASPDCAVAEEVVTCTAGDLAVGAGAEFTLEVTVDPAATGAITNTAAASGNEIDPAAGNDRAVATTAIVLAADLVLSQSDSADPVRPGDEFTWTVTVTNQGPDDAEQVVVTDSLPEGVALVATSGCAEDPAGTPDCTLGTIPAGESRFYELTVSVEPGVAGTLLHSASVTSAMAEAQPGDEESTEATEVVGEADLAVELNGPATAVPGGEVRYTLTVSNLGPDEAVGVQVLDYFVPELVGVSWSRSKRWQGQTEGWQGQTTRTVKRRTDVLSNVSGVGRQEVCPCLPGQKQGQAGEAWQGQTTRTVKRKTDVLSNVSGVRRQEVCPCLPGQKQGQGVLVTTGGGMPAHQRRPDELPQVLALATLGQASGILDDVVDLAAGDAVTYDITATVAAEATDTVGHSAFVESGGVADPNPVNDAATTAAELHPAADLLLALENGRAELIPGKTIAYTAIVSNPGPSDAPPVRLTGTFPLTDATVICTDCEKTSDATELDETFAVPAGGSVVWVVAGTVPDDVEGTLVSEVALELPPDFDDPDPSNNQAMDVDEVIPGEVVTLGPPRRLAEGRNPAVVFSDSGRSLVVFEQGEAGGTSMIRGLDIDASGVPGNDFPLSIDIGLNPAVDLDADLDPDASKQGRGAYLTVWQEEFEPSAVLGQLSRDGRPLGPAMGLSTRPTSQVRPDIVRRPAGGFLVVWESTGADAEEEGIFGRFVDPAGRPVDDVELRINRETERTPQRPVLATDGSRFLVVWDRPAGDDERRIAGQRVTPAGDLAGPTLELSDMAGAQTDPDVAFDQDSGRYMVAWRQQEGDGGGIAGRVFDPAGRPQGEPFLIGSEGDRNPEVSSEEGNFTVVWERALGPRSVTFGQLIDPEGRPVGNEFRVSGSGKGYKDEETGGAQPAVAYAPHGAIAEAGGADVFAVIWGDRTADDAEELNGQRYAVTADLLLTVFDDPDPLPPGASALVYTVVVQNLSTADAADVMVFHQLPAGVTLVISQGCAEDPTATEVCTLGTVEGGGLRQYVLETRVAPGIHGTLPLPATVSSSTPDPDQSDNVADELTRFGIADLEVELSAGNAGAGERATWQLAVTNAGPSPADGSVAAIELPLGVAIVASDGCGEDPSATETCSLGTLAAGAERRVALEVEFSHTLTGTVTPAVSVASGVYDPDLASNTDTAAIEVLATGLEAEIAAPARVAPGIGFTYTVTVTNAGTSPAAGVELIAPLPAGLSLVASGGCAEDPSGMPVCSLGTLDPGDQRRVSFAVAVPEDLRGTLSFGVNVRSSEAATLPTAGANTVVAPAAVLELVDGRFAVRVEYRNQHGDQATGAGQSIPFSESTGFFYFFDPANVELIVKMLDGGAINGHFWFFYGALTDLAYEVLVTDRLTGEERRYDNPAGEICGVGDTAAFPWSKGWHLDGWQGQTTPTVARTTSRAVQVPQASDVKKFALACPGKQQGQGVATAGVGGISSHHHRPDELAQALPLPPLALPSLDNCTPGAEVLCLSGGRFRVEVTWRNQHAGGVEGPGRATAGTDDSGYFWFFDADNLELAVKLLDGRGVNGRFWFFYGGLSDVEYWITVTDTETGESRTYHNPPGEICGGADVSAF